MKSAAFLRAVAEGAQTYVPEAACQRGHWLRSTASRSCIECRKQTERLRTAANRDAYNARKKAERADKKEALAAYMRKRRAAESAERRIHRLEQARVAQHTWRQRNRGRHSITAAKKAYKLRNPGKVRADTVKRRALKMQRTPAWLTADDHWMMEQAYELAALRTRMFGFVWHVDHVVPLQGETVSGLHVPLNLQVMPGVDNVRKANKWAVA